MFVFLNLIIKYKHKIYYEKYIEPPELLQNYTTITVILN